MRCMLLALTLALAGSMTSADENLVSIEVNGESDRLIVIQLNPDVAPGHVERIRTLVQDGQYDGVVFHRVIDGFMAQTGDVKFGTRGNPAIQYAGMGGSDYENLEAEFSDLPFMRGTVGMARAQDPDSANSQFFIMFDDGPFLNGQYTVLGEVISGLDVLDSIKRGDQARNGMVSDPDYMSRVWLGRAEAVN